MHRNLIKLMGRAGVYLEEADGNGNDLPGGLTAEQIAAAEKEKTDKAAADKAAADKVEADRLQAEKDKQNPEGGNKPSDAEAKLLKELMDYKGKAKQAADELKAYKDAAGESKPEELKALIEAKKTAEREALEKRGEYDRILEQVKSEHAKELKALQDKLEEQNLLLSQKDESLVNLTVGRAFSESPFIREKSVIPASIARKEFGTHVDIVDGAAVVYDKPRGASERTPLVGADGKPKSFEEGIAALYAAHPEASAMIRAQSKPGAGSQNADLGGKKPDDQGDKIGSGVSRIAAGLAKKNQ
uniref:DUF6651 domain-containing protein n=1 Tax=Pseudomonas phage Nican01 TaxID=3138540 RepID=A0AAU6W059_9CAUD